MKYIIICIVMLNFACQSTNNKALLYASDTLHISQLSDNTFIHISYLNTDSYGRVACNGAIFIDEGEAIILDTPTDHNAATELINFVQRNLSATIKAVIPTHFHIDCLGSLEVFHNKHIPSFALSTTKELAQKNGREVPQHTFNKTQTWSLNTKEINCIHLGEGHTRDNIVCYYPSEKVLFGGCLIKAMNASKGNLEDANVETWSETVRQIQVTFPDIAHVIPGHGDAGGLDLLRYTQDLFEE